MGILITEFVLTKRLQIVVWNVLPTSDLPLLDWILQASLEDFMLFARNLITLVEATGELTDNIPEATSQAIAMNEVTGCVLILYSPSWLFHYCYYQ